MYNRGNKMTNDISATVDALLVVLILCVIFCAGVVIAVSYTHLTLPTILRV